MSVVTSSKEGAHLQLFGVRRQTNVGHQVVGRVVLQVQALGDGLQQEPDAGLPHHPPVDDRALMHQEQQRGVPPEVQDRRHPLRPEHRLDGPHHRVQTAAQGPHGQTGAFEGIEEGFRIGMPAGDGHDLRHVLDPCGRRQVPAGTSRLPLDHTRAWSPVPYGRSGPQAHPRIWEAVPASPPPVSLRAPPARSGRP